MHTGGSLVFWALIAPVLTLLYHKNMLCYNKGNAPKAGKKIEKRLVTHQNRRLVGHMGWCGEAAVTAWETVLYEALTTTTTN